MSQSWERWHGLDGPAEEETSGPTVAAENAVNIEPSAAVLGSDEILAGVQRPLGYAVGQNALRNLVGSEA